MKIKFILTVILFSLSVLVFSQNQIGVWEVNNGQINTDKNNENDRLAESYWQLITTTLPNDLIDQYVVSLKLFTDGKDDDLGGLIQMDETVGAWQIELDTTDIKITTKDSIVRLDITHTLIHEFGHLLTLNSSQIELTDDKYQDPDKGYLTNEGYARPDSYLELFVKKFWNDDLLHEWDKIEATKKESKKLKLLYGFYFSRKNNFLSEYAAESPEEDIAESWTFFVLSDQPNPNHIKNEKVIFFYQFPELVQYREHIRKNLEFIPYSYIANFQN